MSSMLRPRTLQALGGILLVVQIAGGRAWSQQEPVAPDQILRRAVELQQAGDLEGAIEQYEAFLALYPEAAAVRFNLGNAYGQVGKFEKAIAHYEQAIQSGDLTDPTAARLILSWTYFQAAEFEKARDLLSGIVQERPENREALQLLASSHFRLGEGEKVIELLSPLESELGESPELAYLLGVALVENGQVKRGVSLVETGLQQTDSAEVRFMLGRALMEKGDYFGAATQLERAIALDPKILSLNATYGELLRTMTRHDEANEAFLRELAINPDDYDSNLFHGMYLYENEQKYDEALACFERALRTRPGDALARFHIGLVYNYANRMEEALQTVKGVVEEHPDFRDGQVTLTGLYYRLGREEDAKRHQEIAERLRANRDGQHLIRQRQFSQAVELFERQKKADPSDPQPYFYAGMAFSQAQDWSGAIAEFKEAVRLDPDHPKYISSHANALARTGEHELARAALESLGKAPWQQLDPRLAWLLGDTYYQIGEHDQALEVLDFLAEQDPENANVDLMRGQIHLLKGDHERARVSAQGSIEKQPGNNGPAYSLLGTARYQLGDRPGAKEAADIYLSQDRLGLAYVHLSEMEKIDPRSPTGLLLTAQYWYQRRNYTQALDYGVRAQEADPSNADLRNLLGNLYFSQGQTQQAVQEYEAAVELDPARPEFKINLEVARKKLP